MKNFHHLGTLAFVVSALTGAAILWATFSTSIDPSLQANARLAFRVWIVAVGLFWAWYVREEGRRANPVQFTDAIEFVPQLEVRATFEVADEVLSTLLAPGRTPTAVLAVGGEGFNARLRRVEGSGPEGARATAERVVRLGVQLLSPALALPSLPVGATPRVLFDGGPVGVGEVLRIVPAARP